MAEAEEIMTDLNVVAILTAKPGSEAIVREALEALVEPTKAEAGNRGYELYSSAADPTVFVTMERWASQDDLDAHMMTPHIATALAAASDHLAAAPAIHPLVPIS
jgi:quinol monooxygenase YgiN